MADPSRPPPLTPPLPAVGSRVLLVLGKTRDGRTFRPSDWAERLCGVMSQFRPGGADPRASHLGYSPYVRPTLVDGVRSVIVDERLRDIEPLAWDFVLGFAKDNDLETLDASQTRL